MVVQGVRLVFPRNLEARAFDQVRACRVVELTDGAGSEEREPDVLHEWGPRQVAT